MENQKKKITNKWYRQFLDTGAITLLTPQQIEVALSNVTGRCISEGRALICVAYLTGARPSEYLELKGRDITREGNIITVQMCGTKGGLPRPIYLNYKDIFVKELYKYTMGVFPDLYLFNSFRGYYVHNTISKHTGKRYSNVEISAKLRYYFKKWFRHLEGSISPYFLRHNKFSELSLKGADDNLLQQIKGSKGVESIRSYKHLSTKSAKQILKISGYYKGSNN